MCQKWTWMRPKRLFFSPVIILCKAREKAREESGRRRRLLQRECLWALHIVSVESATVFPKRVTAAGTNDTARRTKRPPLHLVLFLWVNLHSTTWWWARLRQMLVSTSRRSCAE